jgi:hypothetical protein
MARDLLFSQRLDIVFLKGPLGNGTAHLCVVLT